MEATLSSKGQATIPKAVRKRLQIKSGIVSSSSSTRTRFCQNSTARPKGMLPETGPSGIG